MSRTGPRIQIADPAAAADLLDLALESGRQRQRVIFFCSCERPRCDGKIACHRATVAGLVLKAAKKRGVAVETVEWPGNEPRKLNLEVPSAVIAAVRKGRWTVPVGKQVDLASIAGTPWCSIARLHAGKETLHRLVGPAIRKNDEWAVPVLYQYHDPTVGVAEYKKQAVKCRRNWGLISISV